MSKKKRPPPSAEYDLGLIERLRDPQYAVIYLNTILKAKDAGVKERFLTALNLLALMAPQVGPIGSKNNSDMGRGNESKLDPPQPNDFKPGR